MKKLFIETLGCSKNLVDSEQMLGLLDESYTLCDQPEEAEILIVNTCSFIHDAKEESINVILDFAKLKAEGVLETLIVTGCLSQRYPEELLAEIPEIDAIIGTSNFYKVDEVIKKLDQDRTQKIFMESVDLQIPENLPRILTTPSYSAYLKIAEGCDNRCTYCIIPKLRGKYRSRVLEDIIDEAKDLVSMGVKELILIAQDTSRYGIDLYEKPTLPKLLTALNAIEGLKWIRVQYSYPDILDDDLLEGFFSNDKVVNYFDIPIQHASDKILKLMNRKTTHDDILNIIQKIRKRDPEAVIRTTCIVGFPGETEQDFNELLTLVRTVKFDRLGAFTYSNEENTPAFKLPNQVPEAVMVERRDALMALQMNISESLCYSKVGKVYEVVVEEVVEENKLYVGRTQYDSPEIDGVVYINTVGPLEIGHFIQVKIIDALEYDVIGEVYHEHSK
ncbi:30S ribosomal protein S12 methylthiotransferase RimO [Fusibacter ferrireducens]|uniref:Ribosomal protein uS12 methylthiotransferase RimO n=2 Tax=Fusibacter ferrireducens TaxID=2785058 RepID=A0ABR9ZMS9_9FIRM|nr:30S ribosomal protein S12 methylthiotransferase RimO [Fusibacter ferrireducens]MBF4691782.1 30S ribosomal protein S12 methylthiotransferase RimO [Fusibacter ferrireducens]